MDTGPVENAQFKSSGISGGGDVDRVETILSGIEGVRDVEVDPDNGTVAVSYDPTEVSETKLREALIADGYPVGDEDSVGGGLPEGTGSPAEANTNVVPGLADDSTISRS